jgi:hypothetical protein
VKQMNHRGRKGELQHDVIANFDKHLSVRMKSA